MVALKSSGCAKAMPLFSSWWQCMFSFCNLLHLVVDPVLRATSLLSEMLLAEDVSRTNVWRREGLFSKRAVCKTLVQSF